MNSVEPFIFMIYKQFSCHPITDNCNRRTCILGFEDGIIKMVLIQSAWMDYKWILLKKTDPSFIDWNQAYVNKTHTFADEVLLSEAEIFAILL